MEIVKCNPHQLQVNYCNCLSPGLTTCQTKFHLAVTPGHKSWPNKFFCATTFSLLFCPTPLRFRRIQQPKPRQKSPGWIHQFVLVKLWHSWQLTLEKLASTSNWNVETSNWKLKLHWGCWWCWLNIICDVFFSKPSIRINNRVYIETHESNSRATSGTGEGPMHLNVVKWSVLQKCHDLIMI